MNLLNYLNSTTLAPTLPEAEAQAIARHLGELTGLSLYERSITASQRALFALGQRGETKKLVCLSLDQAMAGQFGGEMKPIEWEGTTLSCTLAATTPENAARLRRLLPFLVAQPLGLRKSAGCGDRLGLATPGHIRAIRRSTMVPILAQQSIRENARTGRTPQEVMDDAMWGVFQEGWRQGFGADADHLKTPADIDSCAAAGYTFYTIDPGEYVDDEANHAAAAALQHKVEALPWEVLESSPGDLVKRLANTPIELADFSASLTEVELFRAAAKYGRAVAHTVSMARHLAGVMGERPFELEMSVDETETVTSLAEHLYIAAELRRLGVKVVSLAPRYVGAFEKGVDYQGDLAEFRTSFSQHLAVAQVFGPYKLSLHSGSDKFSIYPIAAQVAGDLVHLKTAGTSYLEALRAIATVQPPLFREIMRFAIARYPIDRASYHVSAQMAEVPDITTLSDSRLPALLDNFHARQALHVTFGSVLNHPDFREPFFETLRRHEDIYTELIEAHFVKHLSPFA
jgi:hypothetical protein